jgi:DNA primase
MPIMKTFDSQTLHALRNAIPMQRLIPMLHLPHKHREGFLRFLCPSCSEMNSAVNPRTNLARCFTCNRNFNTIELTMASRGIPFKQAVQDLLPLVTQK